MSRRKRHALDNHRRRLGKKDTIYNSWKVRWFTCVLMNDGKYAVAYKIVCNAFDLLMADLHSSNLAEDVKKEKVLEAFDQILNKARPLAKVISKRIGGANYQVPVEVNELDGMRVAFNWIIKHARKRAGKTMEQKLYREFIDVLAGKGGAMNERDMSHRMAAANQAFATGRAPAVLTEESAS